MLKFHRPLAFILLAIFLANMGVLSYAKRNLSHELMHAELVQLAPDHVHHDVGSGDPHDDDSLSTAQHHVLHAADHVQFLSGIPGQIIRPEADTNSHLLQLSSLALPRPAVDQPYRPPRPSAPTA
jgi:hypothetical protein